MQRLRALLDSLRSRLWLVPSAMALLASAGALLLPRVQLDAAVDAQGRDRGGLWWLFSGDAGTARDLLATLLSGIMSMTSLVVSITMVVLSLAAGQLGPRLIWIFIRDRQIQAILGLFFATILYLLLVLRGLDVVRDAEAVPHVAVTVGSLLTVACLLALLFHIHKVSRLIISDTVIGSVAGDLDRAIEQLPAPHEAEDGTAILPDMPLRHPLRLARRGYVQTVDYKALLRLAQDEDLFIAVTTRAGRFVLERQIVAEVAHARPDLPDDLERRIARLFVVGNDRSPAQDLEYPLQQLVEIALRALSPGINDPFTAIATLHRLAGALEAIDARALPPRFLRDEAGVCRLEADVTDHVGLVGAAFDRIRQAGQTNPAILIAMADILTQLGGIVRQRSMAQALSREAAMLRRLVDSQPEPLDRAALIASLDAADRALQR